MLLNIMDNIKKELDSHDIKYLSNVENYNYSTMRTSGFLSLLIPVTSVEQFIKIMSILKNTNYYVLGRGSNTLFASFYVKTPIIYFGKQFSKLRILKDKIIVESGMLNIHLVHSLAKLNIGGLEFLSCIPGSIGGSVIMNASFCGENIADVVEKILVYHKGEMFWLSNKKCRFEYRNSLMKKEKMIVLKVVLKAKELSKIIIDRKIVNLIKLKQKTQVMDLPTLGSTFKNPTNYKAYELINNLKMEIDPSRAHISPKHSNFIVNNCKDSGEFILGLINKIKQLVYEDTNIMLEEEISTIYD